MSYSLRFHVYVFVRVSFINFTLDEILAISNNKTKDNVP